MKRKQIKQDYHSKTGICPYCGKEFPVYDTFKYEYIDGRTARPCRHCDKWVDIKFTGLERR